MNGDNLDIAVNQELPFIIELISTPSSSRNTSDGKCLGLGTNWASAQYTLSSIQYKTLPFDTSTCNHIPKLKFKLSDQLYIFSFVLSKVLQLMYLVYFSSTFGIINVATYTIEKSVRFAVVHVIVDSRCFASYIANFSRR